MSCLIGLARETEIRPEIGKNMLFYPFIMGFVKEFEISLMGGISGGDEKVGPIG